MDTPILFLQHLGLSLFLGGLVGLERERNHQQGDVHDFGGIRTLALVAMYGFVVEAFFGAQTVLFAVFSAAFFLLLLFSYIISSYVNKSNGATTEMAVCFVYLVGILVGKGELLIASATTLLVVFLLAFKQTLHMFAKALDKEELYDTLKFIAIVFVVLPLLPNQVFGPLEVLNPYLIWLMVVLVSGISFASYIAIRLLGPQRGIGLSGFFGGLISSTAVAMSFSQLSRLNKKVVSPFVFGILIAATGMFFRVLLEVSVLNPDLLPLLSKTLLSMGGAGIMICLFLWFFQNKKETEKSTTSDFGLSSPLQLLPAIRFGLFFAFLLLFSKFVAINAGDGGLYLAAFISGLLDVDAISISMANLSAAGDIPLRTASIAIGFAVVSNTLVKGGIVLAFASRAVGIRVLVSIGLILGVFALSLSLI